MPDRGLNRTARLLHLSDLHFGAEDVEALARVSEFANRIEPDAVVVSGDLTQTGAKHEFEAARDWLRTIKGTPIVTPGNHDTPVLDMTARVFAPFDRYHRYLGEFDAVDRLVELDQGRIRIAAINTARGVQARRNWADGEVDMKTLRLRSPCLRPAHLRRGAFWFVTTLWLSQGIPGSELTPCAALKRCSAQLHQESMLFSPATSMMPSPMLLKPRRGQWCRWVQGRSQPACAPRLQVFA